MTVDSNDVAQVEMSNSAIGLPGGETKRKSVINDVRNAGGFHPGRPQEELLEAKEQQQAKPSSKHDDSSETSSAGQSSKKKGKATKRISNVVKKLLAFDVVETRHSSIGLPGGEGEGIHVINDIRNTGGFYTGRPHQEQHQAKSSSQQSDSSETSSASKSSTTKEKARKRISNAVQNLLVNPYAKKHAKGENEKSPLLPLVHEDRLLTPEHRSVRFLTPENQTFPLHQKKDYWKIVKNKVEEGDFLLTGSFDHDGCPTTASSRELMEQEAVEEMRNGLEFNVFHCVVAILLYLSISVLWYNFILEVNNWTILDSCYFSMVTFTTVGYGDFVPSSTAGMVFTCLYAISGVACLGIALGILGNNMIDAQERMAERAEKVMQFQVMDVFDVAGGAPSDGLDDLKKGETPHHFLPWYLARASVPLMLLLLGLAYWIGKESGWTLLESVYYLIVTGCTIGYGDLTPTTEKGKLIAVFLIPLAVGATGTWLGGVAHWIVEARQARYRREMGMKELTQHDLEIMDKDNDGTVSRAEFLEFMLVAMNKIDESLVQELRDHFDRLDANGTGELSKGDLVESARRKLRSPTHKLRLAMYKERLLKQARESGEQGPGSLIHALSSRLFASRFSVRFNSQNQDRSARFFH